MPLVSSHRMYDVNDTVAALWAQLFAIAGRRAGVALSPLDYPAPLPLADLWARADMGLVQMCGWPFHCADPQPQAIAAPVMADTRAGGRPVYWSDMVVRADSRFQRLEDTFGTRIAWTAPHSHSGFNAPRHLLLDAFRAHGGPLYRESVGPVISPRGAIDALIGGRADIAPLDGYFHALLQRHEPETAAVLRVVARTALAPVPPLVASHRAPRETAQALRGALLGARDDPAMAPLMDALCIARFCAPDPDDYALTQAWHDSAIAAGYVSAF